jgi:hypothetical protein
MSIVTISEVSLHVLWNCEACFLCINDIPLEQAISVQRFGLKNMFGPTFIGSLR